MIRKLLIANRGEIAVTDHPGLPGNGNRSCGRLFGSRQGSPAYTAGRRSHLYRPWTFRQKLFEYGKHYQCGYDLMVQMPYIRALVSSPKMPDLRRSVRNAASRFIGPPSAGDRRSLEISRMARNTMMAAGVPVIPGTEEAILDAKTGAEKAAQIGYPVIIKAALGGGGKGMRTAFSPEEFELAFLTAQKESQIAFGDGYHVYRTLCGASQTY